MTDSDLYGPEYISLSTKYKKIIFTLLFGLEYIMPE